MDNKKLLDEIQKLEEMKYKINRPETVIKWLAGTLVSAIPEDFKLHELRYWSDQHSHEQLRRQVRDLIGEICLSEWWHRFQSAGVMIEADDIFHFNERRYPLEPSTTATHRTTAPKVHICQFKEFVEDTNKAIHILKHRGKRPATLRETLEHLIRKRRKAWVGVEHWQRRIYIIKPPTTDDKNVYDMVHRCIEIEIMKKSLPTGEIFQAKERQFDCLSSLQPRDWCFVVDL